jgi:hypothetical protein
MTEPDPDAEPTISEVDLEAAEADEEAADAASHPLSDLTGPTIVQRVENGMLAALALTATVILYPQWWWMPFALFLLFDLSMLGYARSARAGAAGYNIVHSYGIPALLGVYALIATLTPLQPLTWWVGLLALSWAFHIGVDRALGYGLKLTDAFEHTHLGPIGRARRA